MDWDQIWENKGRSDTPDLGLLNGWEGTDVDPVKIAQMISETLGVADEDNILEVGCGAGFLAQHLRGQYTGVDKSSTLVARHKEILGAKVMQAEANDLPFSDQEFDYAVCFSVFQYFPDIEYARQAIAELSRVTKKGVFIGDLFHSPPPWQNDPSTRPAHFAHPGTQKYLCVPREELQNWQFSTENITRENRYHAHRLLERQHQKLNT